MVGSTPASPYHIERHMGAITSPILINAMADLIAAKLIEMDKDAHWWAFSKAASKHEKAMIKVLEVLFAAQEADVLRRLKAHPPPAKGVAQKAAGDEWLFNEKEWGDKFEKSGKPIILGAVEQGGKQALVDLGLAINFNVTDPRVQEFIAKKVPKFSFDVNNTTLDQLRREFKNALDAGEGIDLITKRVEKIFGFPEKFRNKRIAQTEIVGAMNRGGHEGKVQSGVVKEKEWVSTRDNLTRDTHLAIDGEVRLLEKRYSNGLMHPGDYAGPAAEVINCLIDPKVPIFTDTGWRPVSKIAVGDKVLTHKNRFRSVTAVLDDKMYKGDAVKVSFMPTQRFTATPDHRILLEGDNWRRISDIIEGDRVMVMAGFCARCHEPIPYWRKYCSFRCNSLNITDRQWSDPEHRKSMSEKTTKQLHREYASGVRNPDTIVAKARKACFDKYGKGGYIGAAIHDPEFQRKGRQAIIDKYGSTLECLKQGAFKALGKASWNGSSIERSMKRYLDGQGRQYNQQFMIGRRRVDFYVEAEKLFIECDSRAYHSDKDKDRRRDLEILLQYPDHQIAHVFYGGGAPKWEFFDLTALNHTNTYRQIAVPVRTVERWPLAQRRRLYNFAVEDDESYIAKGIFMHNCRCTDIASSFK